MIGYHYTSLETAIAILGNAYLHFTNIRFCNDGNEFVYGVKKFRSLSESAFPGLEDEPCPFFICCFSQDSNSFSQWMTYGDRGRGICLGFDLDQMVEGTDVRLAPVEYDVDEQDKLLKQHLVQIQQLGSGEMFQDIVRFKQPGFLSEREVRLVINGTAKPLGYRTREGQIIPFVKFKFTNPERKRLVLKRVILGPSANHPHNRHYLEKYLIANGYEAEVCASDLVL